MSLKQERGVRKEVSRESPDIDYSSGTVRDLCWCVVPSGEKVEKRRRRLFLMWLLLFVLHLHCWRRSQGELNKTLGITIPTQSLRGAYL